MKSFPVFTCFVCVFLSGEFCFTVYGPNGSDGKPPSDLDECNGHTDQERGYHYHVTEKFPYILGAYKGVVDQSNFDHPRPGGARHRGGPPPRLPPPRE